jgi:hypothetical protein
VVADEKTQWGIESYFGWFRRRHANAVALTGVSPPEHPTARAGSFVPEQHVLIGAGIEALATGWARLLKPEGAEGPAGVRWSEFLIENANSSGIFSRVSGPMLGDALEHAGAISAALLVRQLVLDTDEHRGGIVRFADEDPDYATFVARPEVVSLHLPPKKRYVERFRFGEVLYSEYRCHWVHTLAGSDKIARSDFDTFTGQDDESSVRVRYVNWGVRPADEAHGRRRLLVKERRPLFTLKWLLDIYGEAIDTFERFCVTENRDPMP